MIDELERLYKKINSLEVDELIKYGNNLLEAYKHPVRIERRTFNNKDISQIVLRGIWEDYRFIAIDYLEEKIKKEVAIKISGKGSIEFNKVGVNKSLPLKYLYQNYENIFKRDGI